MLAQGGLLQPWDLVDPSVLTEYLDGALLPTSYPSRFSCPIWFWKKYRPKYFQIIVEDENDNAPIFVTSNVDGDVIELGSEIIVNVTEEQAIGSEILKVHAIDKDADDNGKVVYDVMNGQYVEIRNENEG